MKKYWVNTWRRPNRKMKRLLKKLIAENGNVYTYTNRVDSYNDRVGQEHRGMHNLHKAIDKLYPRSYQGTTSMHRPKSLYEQLIIDRTCHQLKEKQK